MAILIIIVGVTVVTVALGIGLVTFQRNEGVFAPVYGPDGRFVYYPGFPRWLIPIADNGSTMGIRRVFGPELSR